MNKGNLSVRSNIHFLIFGATLILIGVLQPVVSAGSDAPRFAEHEGKAQVDLRLSADSSVSPSETRLRINGQDFGTLPKILSLKKGRYILEVHGPAGRLWTHVLKIVSLESIALEASFLAPAQDIVVSSGASSPGTSSSGVGTSDSNENADENAKAYNAQSAPSTGTARAHGASFSVEGAPIGAQIIVDDKAIGTLPLAETPIASGIHTLEVKHPGSKPYRSTFYLKSGEYKAIRAVLDPSESQSAATRSVSRTRPLKDTVTKTTQPIDIRGLSSHGAQLVPIGHFTVQMGTGFPYFLSSRLNTGFFENGVLGLDGGVELRSFFTMTEGDVFSRLRVLVFQPFALAISAAVGGGGGPKSRSSFFGRIGAVGSLFLRNMITITGKVDLNMYSDRYCPRSAVVNGQADGCNVVSGAPLHRNRYNRARLRLTGIVEFAFSESTSLLFMIQGTPFQHARPLYSSDVSSLMPNSDLKFYSGIGAVFKY